MNSCPNCSHNLLNHLRDRERYWYCQHCRLETSELFNSQAKLKDTSSIKIISKM